MEFAIVNNYMGPVATKAMKGYSEEDLRTAIDDYRVSNKELHGGSRKISRKLHGSTFSYSF